MAGRKKERKAILYFLVEQKNIFFSQEYLGCSAPPPLVGSVCNPLSCATLLLLLLLHPRPSCHQMCHPPSPTTTPASYQTWQLHTTLTCCSKVWCSLSRQPTIFFSSQSTWAPYCFSSTPLSMNQPASFASNLSLPNWSWTWLPDIKRFSLNQQEERATATATIGAPVWAKKHVQLEKWWLLWSAPFYL